MDETVVSPPMERDSFATRPPVGDVVPALRTRWRAPSLITVYEVHPCPMRNFNTFPIRALVVPAKAIIVPSTAPSIPDTRRKNWIVVSPRIIMPLMSFTVRRMARIPCVLRPPREKDGVTMLDVSMKILIYNCKSMGSGIRAMRTLNRFPSRLFREPLVPP